MLGRYVLDENGHPRLEPDLLTWWIWFETADRQVAETMTANVRISTVFLGLDHNFRDVGPDAERLPVLWETMVFGDSIRGEIQTRYTSREDALAGHAEVVAEVERMLLERYEASRAKRGK